MDVTLLGTGDTAGTPVPGCSCATCQHAREYGITRHRFSVHIESHRGDQALLIDFSPDFRTQFLENDVRLPDAGIITHVHYDHLSGLGNVYRLLDRNGSFPVHTAAIDNEDDSIAATITDQYGYLRSLSVVEHQPLEPFQCCGLEVTLVPVDHPPLPCYGLRIIDPATGGQLSITGDTSFRIPDRSKAVLRGADMLLADGIVPPDYCTNHPVGGDDHAGDGTPRTFGTKHMTMAGAQEMATELAADRYRVVHASHHYPPEQAFADPIAVDGETHSL